MPMQELSCRYILYGAAWVSASQRVVGAFICKRSYLGLTAPTEGSQQLLMLRRPARTESLLRSQHGSLQLAFGFEAGGRGYLNHAALLCVFHSFQHS